MIAAHSRAGPHRNDEMALGGDANGQLRQTANRLGTARFPAFFPIFRLHPPTGVMAATLVVPADMMRAPEGGHSTLPRPVGSRQSKQECRRAGRIACQ